MLATLNTFFKVCVFKSEPKDVPHSFELLVSLIAFKSVINYFILARETANLNISTFQMFLLTFMGILLSAAFVYALLRYKKFTNRFMQTFTALIAVDIFFKTLAYIFFVQFGDHPLLQLVILLYIWNMLVISFVISKSMEIRLVFAILIMIGFNLFVSMVVQGMLSI